MSEGDHEPLAGLYVHVPFCSAICPYCDFAVTLGGSDRRQDFVATICREADLVGADDWRFDTLYFGGGTPSALEGDLLEELIAGLRSRLGVDEETHLSLEANPEDVDASSCRRWKELGVRTLSLGVQAFDDRSLRFLGRRHSADEARRAVAVALDAGFDCVSVDLIFGFPREARDCQDAVPASLRTVMELSPQHVSCYQLTVHGATPFGVQLRQGRLREMGSDEQAAAFLQIHDELSAGGFEAYEVSNFARAPEFRSRHNQKYWRHVSYLGLGPSAHSFDGRRRWWNERSLVDYATEVQAGRRPVAGEEELSQADLLLEVLMLRLRTSEGLDLESIEERFGVDLLAANQELVERLIGEGRFVLDGARLRPTLKGMAIADSLAAEFSLPKPAFG